MGAVLFFAKGFRRLVRSQEAGVWDQFDTAEVAGQTMGVIGFGDIGKAVARRAEAMAKLAAAVAARARPAGLL